MICQKKCISLHDFNNILLNQNFLNMKKLFLSLMLVAAIAAGFTSCKKDENNESTTHSQTFTLGSDTYNVDNAITIENIQYEGDTYNAIVLSEQIVEDESGEGQGVVIMFKGDITAGTHSISSNMESFPKYLFAALEVTDIVDFDINELMQQEDVYVATSGAFTIGIDGSKYTVTTDNINVEQVTNPEVEFTSAADYEGSVSRYRLATVIEGSLNEDAIVTAGTTKYKIMIDTFIAAFITENGDFVGLTSFNYDFTNGLPEGEFTPDDYPIIMLEKMNFKKMHNAESGNIVISKEGDNYTVDLTNLQFNEVEGTFTLHYIGEMPKFDFPF